jgi:predicted GIY-YIG superfamily endonuclease
VHCVYILKLRDKSIYIGLATDVRKRFAEHQRGGVSTTKNKRPVSLAWYCAFPNKTLAADFERYLKSGSGFSWRKRHLGF